MKKAKAGSSKVNLDDSDDTEIFRSLPVKRKLKPISPQPKKRKLTKPDTSKITSSQNKAKSPRKPPLNRSAPPPTKKNDKKSKKVETISPYFKAKTSDSDVTEEAGSSKEVETSEGSYGSGTTAGTLPPENDSSGKSGEKTLENPAEEVIVELEKETQNSIDGADLTCVLCGKKFDKPVGHVSHMKQCAKRRNISTEELKLRMEARNSAVPSTAASKTEDDNSYKQAMAAAITLSLNNKPGPSGVDRKIIENQKTTLEKFGFTSSHKIAGKRKRKHQRVGKTKLETRTEEERARLLTEKASVILMCHEENTEETQRTLDTLKAGLSQLTSQCPFITQGRTLWDLGESEDLTEPYVPELRPYLSPLKTNQICSTNDERPSGLSAREDLSKDVREEEHVRGGSVGDDWARMVGSSEWSDANVETLDQVVPLHSLVMNVRCPNFNIHSLSEACRTITAATFLSVLSYIYSGMFTMMDDTDMDDVAILANVLNRPDLVKAAVLASASSSSGGSCISTKKSIDGCESFVPNRAQEETPANISSKKSPESSENFDVRGGLLTSQNVSPKKSTSSSDDIPSSLSPKNLADIEHISPKKSPESGVIPSNSKNLKNISSKKSSESSDDIPSSGSPKKLEDIESNISPENFEVNKSQRRSQQTLPNISLKKSPKCIEGTNSPKKSSGSSDDIPSSIPPNNSLEKSPRVSKIIIEKKKELYDPEADTAPVSEDFVDLTQENSPNVEEEKNYWDRDEINFIDDNLERSVEYAKIQSFIDSQTHNEDNMEEEEEDQRERIKLLNMTRNSEEIDLFECEDEEIITTKENGPELVECDGEAAGGRSERVVSTDDDIRIVSIPPKSPAELICVSSDSEQNGNFDGSTDDETPDSVGEKTATNRKRRSSVVRNPHATSVIVPTPRCTPSTPTATSPPKTSTPLLVIPESPEDYVWQPPELECNDYDYGIQGSLLSPSLLHSPRTPRKVLGTGETIARSPPSPSLLHSPRTPSKVLGTADSSSRSPPAVEETPGQPNSSRTPKKIVDTAKPRTPARSPIRCLDEDDLPVLLNTLRTPRKGLDTPGSPTHRQDGSTPIQSLLNCSRTPKKLVTANSSARSLLQCMDAGLQNSSRTPRRIMGTPESPERSPPSPIYADSPRTPCTRLGSPDVEVVTPLSSTKADGAQKRTSRERRRSVVHNKLLLSRTRTMNRRRSRLSHLLTPSVADALDESWGVPSTGDVTPSQAGLNDVTPGQTGLNDVISGADFVEVTPRLTPTTRMRDHATPRPNFDGMNSGSLKKHLQKYGLKKSLGKVKARKILNHFYEELHPIINTKTGKFVKLLPSQPVIGGRGRKVTSRGRGGKGRKVTSRGGGRGRTSRGGSVAADVGRKVTSQRENVAAGRGRKVTSHGDAALCTQKDPTQVDENQVEVVLDSDSDCSVDEETEDELYLEDDDLLSQQPSVAAERLTAAEAIQRYYTAHPVLYTDILHYRPVWVHKLTKDLHSYFNTRFKIGDVMTALDDQCITFRNETQVANTMKRNDRAKARRIKRQEKKKEKETIISASQAPDVQIL